MEKEEIIKKLEESDNKPTIIVTKGGECIAAFPEGINVETIEVEFVRLDKYALALQEDNWAVEILKETMPIDSIVSVVSSKELFSTIEDIYKVQRSNRKADLFKKAFDNSRSIELFLLN